MALDAEQGYKASLLDAGLSASKFIKRTPRTQRDYAHCPGGLLATKSMAGEQAGRPLPTSDATAGVIGACSPRSLL